MGRALEVPGVSGTRAQRLILQLFADAPRVLGREADERLAAQMFEGAFAQSPHGFALVAPDGTLRRINGKFAEIVGMTRTQLIAAGPLSWMDLTHPEDLAADARMVERCLRGEITSYSMVKRYGHPTAERSADWRWAYLTVWTLRDAATGAVIQFVAQVADMTVPVVSVDLAEVARRRAEGDVTAGVFATG